MNLTISSCYNSSSTSWLFLIFPFMIFFNQDTTMSTIFLSNLLSDSCSFYPHHMFFPIINGLLLIAWFQIVSPPCSITSHLISSTLWEPESKNLISNIMIPFITDMQPNYWKCDTCSNTLSFITIVLLSGSFPLNATTFIFPSEIIKLYNKHSPLNLCIPCCQCVLSP